MYECMYEGQGVGGKNICHFFKMFVKSSFANFSVHFVFNVQYIFMFFSQMNTNFIIYINIATVCLFNCLSVCLSHFISIKLHKKTFYLLCELVAQLDKCEVHLKEQKSLRDDLQKKRVKNGNLSHFLLTPTLLPKKGKF